MVIFDIVLYNNDNRKRVNFQNFVYLSIKASHFGGFLLDTQQFIIERQWISLKKEEVKVKEANKEKEVSRDTVPALSLIHIYCPQRRKGCTDH